MFATNIERIFEIVYVHISKNTKQAELYFKGFGRSVFY